MTFPRTSREHPGITPGTPISRLAARHFISRGILVERIYLRYTVFMPSPVRFAQIRHYLERHGWTLARISGSHHTFTKPGELRPLVIPVHHGKVDPIYEKQARKRSE